MPATGKATGLGREKIAHNYLRPGLASLFPRPSQVQRTDTPRRLPCPGRRFPTRSGKGLLPGSELDESSIDTLVVHLTSKCMDEDCQAKSEGIIYLTPLAKFAILFSLKEPK